MTRRARRSPSASEADAGRSPIPDRFRPPATRSGRPAADPRGHGGGARISLCIVARNEAAFLGAAIASASPVVDEVVVVDTGSTDGTTDLARAAGARVVAAAWPGDLGRAHDLPVAHATGDWVLALDADEVLDPRLRHRIGAAVASADRDGYVLPVRNYVYGWPSAKWRGTDPAGPLARGAAGYIPSAPVRLFRRRREYTYSGRVHQTVRPAIEASGGGVGELDVPIHHYGFLRFDRDKSELYRRLAQHHAEQNPGLAQAWVELGVVLLGDGRPAGAVHVFDRGRALGDPAGAFFLGTTLVDLGHPDAGVPFLREAIAENGEDSSPFYDRADAWEALGLAHDEAGRREDAEDAYRAALGLRPDSPAAAANLAALLLEERRLVEAERLLGDLAERHRGSATVWSLHGALRLRHGDLDGARAALATALDIRPESLAALVNLGRAHARAGRQRQAARAYAAAAERLGSPEARSLELERRLPARYRRPRRRRLTSAPGGVLSLVATLGGGAGRVAVDAALALRGRPQLVVCAEPQTVSGQGLRRELQAIGVDVVVVPSEAALRVVLAQAAPSVVLHHWWRNEIFTGVLRGTEARWVCIGHVPLPMPHGYDAYVVNSAFNDRIQVDLPSERVFRFPNGVELQRFASSARDAGRAPVTIAMLSRLEPGKFPRRLLEHLPSLDGARLVVGGVGGRRHELEPEIARRGLADRVRFVGMVPSPRVPSFLRAADIGLHLTETHEELCPMTVLEMLAAGLPVVAEPKGGLPEMVVSGENGFLASGEREVAERLRELVDSPELRRRLGEESVGVARRYGMASFRSSVRRLVETVERAPGVAAFEHPRGRGVRKRQRAPERRTPVLTYLVCGTPRSGSSLLCEALAGTGLAGNPSEYFEATTMHTLAGRWGARSIETYLEELFDRTATPNGVVGSKLLTAEPPELLVELRRAPGRARLGAPALLAEALPNLRYVLLTRRDRLRQAISLERAAQTDAWVDVAEHVHVALPRPRFDRRAIEARLDELAAGEASWQSFFAEAGAAPVEVVYEELAADYEGTARRVLRGLGIEIPGALWLAPRRLVRQADAVTDRWVERFRGSPARRRADGYAPSAATRSSTPAHTAEAS